MSNPDRDAIERGKDAARSNLLTAPLLAAAGFIASIAVVRALAPEDFAIYAVVLAFRGTAQFAGDFGTGAAATRLFAELQSRGASRQAKLAYARLGGLRLAIGAVFVVAVTVFHDAFGEALGLRADERSLVPLLAVIGLVEVTSSLGYYILAGTLRHRWINRIAVSTTTLQPVLVIAAAAAGLGLSGIVAGVLVGSVARAVAFHAGAFISISRIGAGRSAGAGMARAYMRTASGSIAGKIAAWVHSRQLVTLLAISAVDRVQVAVFALAYDLIHQVFGAISAPFYSLLLPMQSSLAAEEERGRQMFLMATRVLALIILPTAAILVVLFPPLVSVLFGNDYADASVFGTIFIPAYAVEVVLSGPATALMLADDRLIAPYRRIKLLTLAAGLAYVMLTGTSLVVVAIVMMSVRLASALALTVAIRRKLGFSGVGPWVRPLLVTVCGIVAAALSARALAPSDELEMAGGLCAAIVAAVLLVRKVGLVEPSDLLLATEILPRGAGVLRILVPASVRNRSTGR